MLYVIIGIALFIIDQLTKILTVSNFSQFESITVINGVLDFTRYHNTGGPWSFLDEHSWIFIIFTIIIFLGEYLYFRKHPLSHPLSKITCVLINAGAVGNFIDRIFRGYVVDMIKVTFIDYPVFNFADCLIVIGCILMCIYVLFIQKEPEMNAYNTQNIHTEDDSENGKDNN